MRHRRLAPASNLRSEPAVWRQSYLIFNSISFSKHKICFGIKSPTRPLRHTSQRHTNRIQRKWRIVIQSSVVVYHCSAYSDRRPHDKCCSASYTCARAPPHIQITSRHMFYSRRAHTSHKCICRSSPRNYEL